MNDEESFFQTDFSIEKLKQQRIKESDPKGNPAKFASKILYFQIVDDHCYTAQSGFIAQRSGLIYKGHQGPVTHLVVSLPFLFTSSWDKTIKKWDLNTAELLMTFTGHKDFVKSIKVCGNRLYSASSDSLIFEWDIESGAILKTYNGHKRCVDDLALTFDGSYLFSASSDNSIIKWNASTGEQVATLLGHETSIYSIYLTSDESALWSCSADKTARRWDLETMKQDMKLVHPDYVKSVTVLPNGIIATGCRDEHIRLWDPSSEKCIALIEGHFGEVSCLAFHNGLLWSGSLDQTIRSWDCSDLKSIGKPARVETESFGLSKEEEEELASLM